MGLLVTVMMDSVMGCDGYVIAEIPVGENCDGYDAFSENFLQEKVEG